MHNDLPTVVTSNWTEREFSLYHSRSASRLKAAVHAHISAQAASISHMVAAALPRTAHDSSLAGWVKHGEHKGQIRCHITGQRRNANCA